MVTIERVVNVASVPQRSPFRYPGGKTWIVPQVRKWLKSLPSRPTQFVEPFAGGAIVGLTVAFEHLADTVVLIELDADVAAVWETIFNLGEAGKLAERILRFDMTHDHAVAALRRAPQSTLERAFATILRNRVQHGGIMAPGASLMEQGENGKGIGSRWYPETLARRIRDLDTIRQRVQFRQTDGLDYLKTCPEPSAAFFIDPPYTMAGKRLYAHNEVDHEQLFALAAALPGHVLLTYDDTEYIRGLASRHGFEAARIAMQSRQLTRKHELLIGRNLSWTRA